MSIFMAPAFPKKSGNKKRTPGTRTCAQNPLSGVDPKQRTKAGARYLRTKFAFREPPKRCKKDAKNEFSTQIATTSAFRKSRARVPPQRNPFFYPKNEFCMHFYTVWRRSKNNGKTHGPSHFSSSEKTSKTQSYFKKGKDGIRSPSSLRSGMLFLTSKIDFTSVFAIR